MNEKLSLTELQLIIRDSIYTGMPGLYWVVAEIAEYKENYAGHCYLELVEKHPDDINIRAKIKGIIWSARARIINPLFENVTGQKLKAGIKILVRTKIEYHEIYGISLIISDIDPSFTLGEMALRKQQVIRRLEEEGVISMNRELELSPLPQRIAIISSSGAAGYSDFMKHLSHNIYGYRFITTLFDTVMQGSETEESLIGSLNKIAGMINNFDLVVIIRGGGSQTDLSWFDSYNIAYHVTQFPLPVITGIGHEKDISVTDMVAWRSEKTPTAVADFLIGQTAATEDHLRELAEGISEQTRIILDEARDKLTSAMMKLIPVTGRMISAARERLSMRKVGIENVTREIMLRKRYMLSSFAERIEYLNPENILRRGFTITSLNGIIIKSAGSVKEGEMVETRFHDGKTLSKIIKRDKNG